MASGLRSKTITGLALAGAAGALFVFGSGGAIAPERTAGSLQACLPDAQESAAATDEPGWAPDPTQRALVVYLSRRFTIAAEATEHMVETAYRVASEVGLDPLLVLAVISVESRFNPIAESAMGAKGLMQIIPRYHQDRLAPLGGDAAVLDPESNIQLGAAILQEYVYRTGTLEAGLQYYNGALADGSAQYAQKVLAERERIEQAVRPAAASRHAAPASTDPQGS